MSTLYYSMSNAEEFVKKFTFPNDLFSCSVDPKCETTLIAQSKFYPVDVIMIRDPKADLPRLGADSEFIEIDIYNIEDFAFPVFRFLDALLADAVVTKNMFMSLVQVFVCMRLTDKAESSQSSAASSQEITSSESTTSFASLEEEDAFVAGLVSFDGMAIDAPSNSAPSSPPPLSTSTESYVTADESSFFPGPGDFAGLANRTTDDKAPPTLATFPPPTDPYYSFEQRREIVRSLIGEMGEEYTAFEKRAAAKKRKTSTLEEDDSDDECLNDVLKFKKQCYQSAGVLSDSDDEEVPAVVRKRPRTAEPSIDTSFFGNDGGKKPELTPTQRKLIKDRHEAALAAVEFKHRAKQATANEPVIAIRNCETFYNKKLVRLSLGARVITIVEGDRTLFSIDAANVQYIFMDEIRVDASDRQLVYIVSKYNAYPIRIPKASMPYFVNHFKTTLKIDDFTIREVVPEFFGNQHGFVIAKPGIVISSTLVFVRFDAMRDIEFVFSPEDDKLEMHYTATIKDPSSGRDVDRKSVLIMHAVNPDKIFETVRIATGLKVRVPANWNK